MKQKLLDLYIYLVHGYLLENFMVGYKAGVVGEAEGGYQGEEK